MKKEDVDKMSLQEAMDYAIDKIVEQGGQCMIDDICAYGNDKGQHCGVGWLLDEENEELMSYKGGVGELLGMFEEDVPELIEIERRAFEDFQNLHDAEWANGAGGRADFLNMLRKEHDIDTTTNPSWGVWVEMGI